MICPSRTPCRNPLRSRDLLEHVEGFALRNPVEIELVTDLLEASREGGPREHGLDVRDVYGPGDDAEPVITIKFPGED